MTLISRMPNHHLVAQLAAWPALIDLRPKTCMILSINVLDARGVLYRQLAQYFSLVKREQKHITYF
jgi:hypothetical protein